jgi:apolipoprotein D and lipocalin family protein
MKSMNPLTLRGRTPIKGMILVLSLLLLCSCAEKPPPDDHSVEKVDLERYTGRWYEIASFPAPFQKDCHCTTAEYVSKGDYLQVINRCRRGSAEGEWDEATGKARPVEGSNNSRLKVSFFWPFKGDYWVIALDRDYQWVLVGHPQRRYLWILSRTPRISKALYDSLVERAASLGYDVTRLKIMDQSCGE